MMNQELELLSKPGDTLLETIEYLGMSRAELSRRLKCEMSTIDALISGQLVISIGIALDLEKILGIDFNFWLNREKKYRKKLQEILEKGVTMENKLNLTEQICPDCGVQFYVPEVVLQKRQSTGGSVSCYNGHALSFGKPQSEVIVEEIEKEYQNQISFLQDNLAKEKEKHASDLMILQKGLNTLNSQLKAIN
jgi:plasmid maintenance system antidote protein VapI